MGQNAELFNSIQSFKIPEARHMNKSYSQYIMDWEEETRIYNEWAGTGDKRLTDAMRMMLLEQAVIGVERWRPSRTIMI